MSLVEYSIKNRTVTLVLCAVLLFAGFQAFNGMSRLEDPEFTIKDALVITPYPGASAAEVEGEVTDEIEIAVQKLSQLKEIESKSDRGLSTVTVTIQDKYDRSSLPRSGTSCGARSATPRANCRRAPRPRSSSTTTATCSGSSPSSTVRSTITPSSRR